MAYASWLSQQTGEPGGPRPRRRGRRLRVVRMGASSFGEAPSKCVARTRGSVACGWRRLWGRIQNEPACMARGTWLARCGSVT